MGGLKDGQMKTYENIVLRARDGSDQSTREGLSAANEAYLDANHRLHSESGSEFPSTPGGYKEMDDQESAYGKTVKIEKVSIE